jgi:arabinogalactan endo-1,4-beta-galactosidase
MKKMRQTGIYRVIAFISIIILCSASSCKKGSGGGGNNPPIDPTPTNFVKGGDISWLTQMESNGLKFYNSSGTEQDCMQVLKGVGMNTVRLRVWVNPSPATWNNTADVVAKAVRAKNLGLRIMIDFHYSDTWADPGHQAKPAAWAAQDFATLKTSVYNHTVDVLTALKNNGITPEWVQVGNETNDGMLWPDGKASVNMSNFAQLVNAGYDAVKFISNSIKVIVHVSNGYDNSLFRWMFDGLTANGAKWDIIGMSLYPSTANWTNLNTQCLANMNDMVSRYNKDVMVLEVGMSWDQASTCNAFLADLIAKVKLVPNNRGLGVVYWEPECYNNWQGYSLGAFDNSGKPTVALNAFN